jgi:hypothetical protein
MVMTGLRKSAWKLKKKILSSQVTTRQQSACTQSSDNQYLSIFFFRRSYKSDEALKSQNLQKLILKHLSAFQAALENPFPPA